jgi:hypothetical protein
MVAKHLQAHLEKKPQAYVVCKRKHKRQASESSGLPTKKHYTGNFGRRIALKPKPLNTKISEDINAGKKASMNVE